MDGSCLPSRSRNLPQTKLNQTVSIEGRPRAVTLSVAIKPSSSAQTLLKVVERTNVDSGVEFSGKEHVRRVPDDLHHVVVLRVLDGIGTAGAPVYGSVDKLSILSIWKNLHL